MRRSVAVVLTVLATGACARSPGEAGGLTVLPLGGEVQLLGGDEPVMLEEETVVDVGDLVATGPTGRALLQLGPAGTLELGSQAQVRVDSRPEVLRGSVLARAARLGVRAGDADIAAEDSVFRVDRGFSVTVAVYRGAAELLGSGIGAVPELRQATVLAGGTVPRGPRPLTVRPNHPWDIRLLGAAIDLGIELVELQRGLTRQLPARAGEAAVLRALDQAIPPRTIAEVLRRVAAAETVVAAEVSRRAAVLSDSSVAEVLDEVVDFRLEGAHWIVVVARWGLGGTGLLDGLERLAGVIERLVAPVGRGTERRQAGSGAGGSAGTGSLDTGTTGGASGGGSSGGGTEDTTTGGGPGGGGATSPPPEQGCANEVECLVDDLVGELGGPPLPGGGGGVVP